MGKFQIINKTDYLLHAGRTTVIASDSPILPLHTDFKHPAYDSEITTGTYYPRCDKIVIMCDTKEKAQKLYDKYSKYKKTKGNSVFTNEPAFKLILMKSIKSTSKKFKFIKKEMTINNCVATPYRFGLGIGPEFTENDYIFFLKSSAVDTIKDDAPHIFIQPDIMLIPVLKIAKDSQNVLLKKSRVQTNVLHTFVNFK